uniref:Proteasome subunit beta n=1 Tax=Bicosoecida sp. CB-2014 TaxID=1486930 RepID=A0A7S1CP82_9STRA|mmetsp:Transcript_7885/g.27954  ORF Transcript_7885/g.27954 Transcript_7885/m.27954 type:complete len:195 (+) Transcript_7885:224-808(+)|eukprot:CAMPEP_0203811588 /NCGR_PEP_ID=MMETSP0115-20131106/3654_1 /ASSEMBLY_ACC=CAM_ASM_000227 /TAXON_ID=33651 /ORGANISM="Bicosoecid sp, Strain ms1" /LENGTH=194 /DNA_ID=CAMNT_0050720413 /DNA_START=192 /DNA_END=776 /DNA_ORIENTATION=+
MDSIIGCVGKDFAVLIADATQARSILTYKHDEDKIVHLSKSVMAAAAGEHGDRIQFTEYVQKNIALHELRTDMTLDTHSAAHYTRRELATALRKNPYNVNLLLAGWDADAGASLYFLDYMSSMQKMNFAAHGYAGYFCYSLLDRHWKAGMSLEEATALMGKCVTELRTRFMLHQPKFVLKVVDKDGIRTEEFAP